MGEVRLIEFSPRGGVLYLSGIGASRLKYGHSFHQVKVALVSSNVLHSPRQFRRILGLITLLAY